MKVGDLLAARGFVRSSVPGRQLCLQIREARSASVIKTAETCLAGTAAWQRFLPTRLTVQKSGDAVDLLVYQRSPAVGDTFEVDGVTLAKQPPLPPPPPPSPSDPKILSAGDIASCASSGDESTAAILQLNPNLPILTAGDNVYEKGTTSEFGSCFEPSWGPFKGRIHPTPGEHEYFSPGAAGYYAYFGAAAGDPAKGYYSFDIGAWHVVALNTNCRAAGGCDVGSPEEQWLRADLATHQTRCVLAYGAVPRFSSGTTHGSDLGVRAFWQALYDYDADIVLAGHEHLYERFAPQTARGVADPERGIREFVVGTGGRGHYPFGAPVANSEVRDNTTFGLLKMTLHANSYDWQFLPEAGKTFADVGSGTCH